MDVMRTRYVKRMEKCSVASREVSGHFARSNSIDLLIKQKYVCVSLCFSVCSVPLYRRKNY